MISKEFKAKIIGKTTEQSGLIFKKTIYLIALKFNDGTTDTRQVPYHQYCSVNIDDTIYITLYQGLNGRWYYNAEDASFSGCSAPNGWGI